MVKLHGALIDLGAIALTVLVGTLMLECLRPAPPEGIELASSHVLESTLER